jgi:EAL domain-containing protein (putative c-di-GMP-specific phosphodiesterase class I)/GGDEF domain-containing protein
MLVYLVMEHRSHSERVYHLAHYNELTGAPNLLTFKERVKALINEHPGRIYAMIRFNVDKLSLLNEIYSYDIGDRILRCVSQALEATIDDKFEAYGNAYGDRFFILLECSSYIEITERKKEFDKYFYDCMGDTINYKVKFPSGWYILEKGEADLSSVIGKVSFAHLIARQTRLANNEIQCYDDKMKRDAIFEKEMEDRMQESLENGDFKMFLQPKFYVSDEKLAGAEALAKWDLDGVMISPAMFIPIFEKNGFVIKLDMYIFEQACIFLRNLIDMGKTAFKISVNFSRYHFSNKDFVSELCKITNKHGISNTLLEVELTESTMLEDQSAMMRVLDDLHEHGFTLSIDDFGAGYSSLSLLKDFFVDVVKFDRSFLESSRDVDRAWQIVSSAMIMSKKLNIQVVAEGVEIKEHYDKLKEMGCDIIQGFYYSRPVFPDVFIKNFLNDDLKK